MITDILCAITDIDDTNAVAQGLAGRPGRAILLTGKACVNDLSVIVKVHREFLVERAASTSLLSAVTDHNETGFTSVNVIEWDFSNSVSSGSLERFIRSVAQAGCYEFVRKHQVALVPTVVVHKVTQGACSWYIVVMGVSGNTDRLPAVLICGPDDYVMQARTLSRLLSAGMVDTASEWTELADWTYLGESRCSLLMQSGMKPNNSWVASGNILLPIDLALLAFNLDVRGTRFMTQYNPGEGSLPGVVSEDGEPLTFESSLDNACTIIDLDEVRYWLEENRRA